MLSNTFWNLSEAKDVWWMWFGYSYDKKNGKGEKETTILTVMEDYPVNQSFD